jgi:dCTP deaminase
VVAFPQDFSKLEGDSNHDSDSYLRMILSDKRILEEMAKGTIVISPFDRRHLGSNSYDVHLGKWLATYKNDILDAKVHNDVEYFEIPEEGLILLPHRLYLGVTEEYTETHAHVPFLEGKSSIGRLGIDIHATAGKGDIGFCNTWTLEISVKQPVRIYRGMPIGQLIYFEVDGEVLTNYRNKPSAKYTERTDKPVESMMWKNFLKEDTSPPRRR